MKTPLEISTGVRLLLLLWRGALRRARQRLAAILLLVIGIAISCSALMAVLYASTASIQSFADSAGQVAGPGSVFLRSRAGFFPLSAARILVQELPESAGVVAVLETSVPVSVDGGASERLPLIGAQVLFSAGEASLPDFSQTEERIVWMPEPDSRRAGPWPRTLNFTMPGGETKALPVREGQGGERLRAGIYVSLHDAWWLTGREGFVSGLSLAAASEQEADLRARLRGFVERDASGIPFFVETQESRQATATKLLAAFRLNLLVMVGMAFLVCTLCVFNVAQLSMLKLQHDFRVLRTLGLSPVLLRASLMLEFAVYGALGGAAGLTLGQPLADLLVRLVTGTAQELYLGHGSMLGMESVPALWVYAACFASAVVSAMAGAIYSAWRAGEVPAGFAKGGLPVLKTPSSSRFTVAGILLVSGAFSLALLAARQGVSLLAYLAVAAGIVSAFLFAPPMLALLTSFRLRAAARRVSLQAMLALANIRASLPSQALVVGVSSSALALLIALTLMVGSFRAALDSWVRLTFQADLFIRPADEGGPLSPRYLPDSVADALSMMPEVADVVRYSGLTIEHQGQLVTVAGSELEKNAARGIYNVLQGRLSTITDSSALLSESAARRFGLGVGDIIDLSGAAFSITAVYQDFSSERGYILIPYSRFRTLYRVPGDSSLSVYKAAHVPPEELKAKISPHLQAGDSRLTDNKTLRGLVFAIFDRTFSITRALELIVLILSALGFSVSLLQLLSERDHELKAMQLIGFSQRELRTGLAWEGVAVFLPTVLAGSLLGTFFAWVLTAIINPLSFGWSFNLILSWRAYADGAAIVMAALLCACLVPAMRLERVLREAKVSDE